jgi:hypothetical protein
MPSATEYEKLGRMAAEWMKIRKPLNKHDIHQQEKRWLQLYAQWLLVTKPEDRRG